MKTIVTDRLIIRKFEQSDWQDMYEYLSDKETVAFEPYDIYSEAQTKEEAARRSDDESFYAVCLKGSEKLIGNLYLGKEDYNTWELGYVFNRKYQGRGYATEGAKALLGHAFTHLGARRIIAMCNPKNDHSWKLLERLHMRREGLLLQNIYFKTDSNGDPVWLDTFEYAILRPEWSQWYREVTQ